MNADDLDQVTREVARRLTPIVSRAAREAIGSAVDFGGIPQVVRRPGTIGTNLIKPGQSGSVKLDGDVNASTAQNTSGYTVLPGSRVMVVLDPPHGAFIESAITPPGSWVLIDQIKTLTVAGTMAFTNIDQGYKSLRLEARLRSAATPGTVYDGSTLKINADAGANYYDELLVTNNAVVSAAGPTNRSGGFFMGYVPSTNSTTARGGLIEVEIPGYRETVFAAHGGLVRAEMLDTTSLTVHGGWYWAPAVMAAISRLDMVPGTGSTWAIGSWARLWAAG